MKWLDLYVFSSLLLCFSIMTRFKRNASSSNVIVVLYREWQSKWDTVIFNINQSIFQKFVFSPKNDDFPYEIRVKLSENWYLTLSSIPCIICSLKCRSRCRWLDIEKNITTTTNLVLCEPMRTIDQIDQTPNIGVKTLRKQKFQEITRNFKNLRFSNRTILVFVLSIEPSLIE